MNVKKIMRIDKMEQEIIKYQKYDIFAGKIPINLHKFESISSYEGTCLTFIFYILMILFIFLNSPGDILWRLFPNVSQSYMNQDTTHEVNFGQGEFFFFFNVFNSKNEILKDESYIYTRLRIKTVFHDGKTNDSIKYFDINNCKKEDFANNTYVEDVKIQEKLIGNYYCPDFKDYTVSGSSLESYTNIGQVVIYPCYFNNTGERQCKKKEEIEEYIYENKLKLKIIYPVPIVKIMNISDPFYYKLNEDYFYLSNNLNNYRYINYGFDKIELITDKNIFVMDSEEKFEYEMNILNQDQRRIDDHDPRFFSLDFKSSFMLTTYKRVYLKLLDCLSTIGGFYPILFMVFEIFHSFFSQISILQYMMDKIFNINNPLNYTKRKKIDIDFSKLDQNEKKEKNKIPNGSSVWWKPRKKSLLDRSDMLFPQNKGLELRKFNIEDNEVPKTDKLANEFEVIDLRVKNQDIDDISENREIIDNSAAQSAKKEEEKDNNSVKEYYIQTLKNMRVKANITFETDFKAYFNWTKFFGYGKDTNSKKYKLKKLLDKIQEKVSDYFDYLNVIRCIDELTIIKSLIFEKHELPLISVMRIPTVDLGEDFDLEKFNIKFCNELEEKIKEEDMETGVEKLLTQEKNSTTAKRILKNLRDMSEGN